jgi:hypothetical protein
MRACRTEYAHRVHGSKRFCIAAIVALRARRNTHSLRDAIAHSKAVDHGQCIAARCALRGQRS